MASFIRKLFGGGGGGGGSPAPAPKPKPAVIPKQQPNSPEQADGGTIKKTGLRGGKKTRTNYTSPLGLSERDKSGIALKQLTGQ